MSGRGGESQRPGHPRAHSSWSPGPRPASPEWRAARADVRAAGRCRDASRPESTPSARQPEWTKVIAEVTPWNTSRKGGWCECTWRRELSDRWRPGRATGLGCERRSLRSKARGTRGVSQLASCTPGGADHQPSSACLAAFFSSSPYMGAQAPLPGLRSPLPLPLSCVSCLCLTLPTSSRSPPSAPPLHWVWAWSVESPAFG